MEGTSGFDKLLLYTTVDKGISLELFCINNLKYLQSFFK